MVSTHARRIIEEVLALPEPEQRAVKAALLGHEPSEAVEIEEDAWLDVIEQRCLSGRNGASWFVSQVHARSGEGDRHTVLARVLRDYRERMHTNEPVHTWGD